MKINALFAMRKSDILDRIIKHYDLKNKTGLAGFLGVSPQTVSNWYSRDSIDYDLIFEKCSGMDFNWLVFGDSYGYMNYSDNQNIANDHGVAYELPSIRNRMIPVINNDTDAFVGKEGTASKYMDWVFIPENLLSEGEYVAYRTDESMEPSFRRGGYVICKHLVDYSICKLKESAVYIFALSDEKVVMRRLFFEKNSPNRIILRADSPDKVLYPDYSVNIKDLKGVWEAKLTMEQPDGGAEDLHKRFRDLENEVVELKKAVEGLLKRRTL